MVYVNNDLSRSRKFSVVSWLPEFKMADNEPTVPYNSICIRRKYHNNFDGYLHSFDSTPITSDDDDDRQPKIKMVTYKPEVRCSIPGLG